MVLVSLFFAHISLWCHKREIKEGLVIGIVHYLLVIMVLKSDGFKLKLLK